MSSRNNLHEVFLAAALAAAFFFLYAHFGLRLAQGVYFDYLNLGFDFDPPYFIDYLVGQLSTSVNYKHPLAMVFRPFARFFSTLGFAPKESAALVMAFFGGLTIAVVYGFCRLANFGLPEAIGATIFYGASSTPIFTSMIVESYGWACFSIALVWFVFLYSTNGQISNSKSRLLVAVLAAGVTITNVMHSLLAEFFIWLKEKGIKNTLIYTAFFGMAVATALFFLLAVLQPQGLWEILTRPLQTVKEVYWLRTKGDTAGFSDLLVTYFGYSFYAPAFTNFSISPVVLMVDFRDFSYKWHETLVVYLWWAFGIFGFIASFKNARYRIVAIPLLAVIAVNLLFHLDYQYRGSLFLYSAHLHFPIFALSVGAAPWITTQKLRIRASFLSMLVVLAIGALFINSQRANEFSRMFDTLTYPADDLSIANERR